MNAGRDAVHRHATDIDALDYTIAHDHIEEVTIVVATQMGIDTVVEIMEETTDVAAGRCHVLLQTLARFRLDRTMGRLGQRRGTTVNALCPEREHHVTRAGQERPKLSRRAILVSCFIKNDI